MKTLQVGMKIRNCAPLACHQISFEVRPPDLTAGFFPAPCANPLYIEQVISFQAYSLSSSQLPRPKLVLFRPALTTAMCATSDNAPYTCSDPYDRQLPRTYWCLFKPIHLVEIW